MIYSTELPLFVVKLKKLTLVHIFQKVGPKLSVQ